MIATLWSFRPRPGLEAEFEVAYGPDGRWADLFRRSADYLGTELMRPADAAGMYLTIDRWASAEARDRFLDAHRGRYEELDRECEALTESEVRIGSFEPLP